MAWTRLVNVHSGALETYTIDAMPPYVAASHAWSDNLFAPGVAFNDSPGCKMILASVRALFAGIMHCWVDTICIDQSNEKDKERQIPLMGDIYGKAHAVIITTTNEYKMTQAFLDKTTKDMEEAIYIASEEAFTEDMTIYWQNGKGRQKIIEAMDCLEVFTRTRWADRIWTLQEYILGHIIVWIGTDNIPLQIDDILFVALPDLCDVLNINEAIGGKYSKIYAFYQGMATCRLKKIDRTRVMELLGNRIASFPDDEIYGAMSASGVIIESGIVSGEENVWRMWWEEAVRQGNHRWIFLPPVVDRRTGNLLTSGNCLMPSFKVRHKASQNSGLDTIRVATGTVNVVEGNVQLNGRWAGSCKIVRRLGMVCEDARGLLHRDLTLILFSNGSWQMAMRIASAFGGGRYSWKQILAIAQILQANYTRAVTAVRKCMEGGLRLRRLTRYQSIVWNDFMQLAMGQMLPMNDGVAYLAQIANETKSTDIIIVTDDSQPKNGLHALDFGVQNVNRRSTFMIVAARETHKCQTNTRSITLKEHPLHKVGMSLPTIVTRNIHKARAYRCHTITSDLRVFSLSGPSCICHGPAREARISPSASVENC
jgi:hypothetical protein